MLTTTDHSVEQNRRLEDGLPVQDVDRILKQALSEIGAEELSLLEDDLVVKRVQRQEKFKPSHPRIQTIALHGLEDNLALRAVRDHYSFTQSEIDMLARQAENLSSLIRVERRERECETLREQYQESNLECKRLRAKLERVEHQKRSSTLLAQGVVREYFGSHRRLAKLMGELPSLALHSDLARNIKEELGRSETLVKALLDGAGLLTRDVQNQKVNLSFVLWQCVERLEEQKRAKKLQLSRPRLPNIKGDPQQWAFLFSEILKNSLKAVKAGGKIEISYTGNVEKLHFTVIDDGSGVPEDKREKVFEPFQRVGGSAYSLDQTGLGLYHCRLLVESWGGKIWFGEPPACGGAALHWTVPLAV